MAEQDGATFKDVVDTLMKVFGYTEHRWDRLSFPEFCKRLIGCLERDYEERQAIQEQLRRLEELVGEEYPSVWASKALEYCIDKLEEIKEGPLGLQYWLKLNAERGRRRDETNEHMKRRMYKAVFGEEDVGERPFYELRYDEPEISLSEDHDRYTPVKRYVCKRFGAHYVGNWGWALTQMRSGKCVATGIDSPHQSTPHRIHNCELQYWGHAEGRWNNHKEHRHQDLNHADCSWFVVPCPCAEGEDADEAGPEAPEGYELWPLASLDDGVFVIEPEWGSDRYRPDSVPQKFPGRFCCWVWITEEGEDYSTHWWRLKKKDRPPQEYTPEPDGISTADYALMRERG